MHLGQDYQEYLHTTKNTDFENIKQLFEISQKLILDQSEDFYGISAINCNTIPKLRSALLNDRAVKLRTAAVCGFSDSVHGLGKITEYPRQMPRWPMGGVCRGCNRTGAEFVCEDEVGHNLHALVQNFFGGDCITADCSLFPIACCPGASLPREREKGTRPRSLQRASFLAPICLSGGV